MSTVPNTYHEENHPKLTDLKITTCYICDKPLSGTLDSDHIIPDHFFRRSDQHRPQLLVHHDCNNAKSRDDKFAVLELQTLCSLIQKPKPTLPNF